MPSLGYGLDPYGDPEPWPENPGYGSPVYEPPGPILGEGGSVISPEVYIVETSQRSGSTVI